MLIHKNNFLKLIKSIKEINDADLENLMIYDEHINKIELTKEQIEEWRFVGLNNMEFLKELFGIDNIEEEIEEENE